MKQFTEKISDMLLNVLIGHKFPYCESATCADVLDWIIDAGFRVGFVRTEVCPKCVLYIGNNAKTASDHICKNFTGESIKECIEQAIIELAPIFEH